VGPRALTAQGDEGLKAGRIPLECKLYSTQNESQPARESLLNSRKVHCPAHTNYRACQPTTRVIQSGLSSASLSWYEKEAARPKSMSHDDVQFQRRLSLPTETNQQVRLASPKVFYNSWIQGHQVTQTRTPASGKIPLLETPANAKAEGLDYTNANQTSTPRNMRELPTAHDRLNFVISDKDPSVSPIAPDQPVAHNAAVSEFDHHELDNSADNTKRSPVSAVVPMSTATVSVKKSNTNANSTGQSNNWPNVATPRANKALESHDNENSLRNRNIPCPPNSGVSRESPVRDSTSLPTALRLANFTTKLVRCQSDNTSSRSIAPSSVLVSKSDGEEKRIRSPTDMDLTQTDEPVVPTMLKTLSSRLNSNSKTETQLSNLAESTPIKQDAQEEPESSSTTEPYNSQVLHEPKPKKRHRKGKGSLLKKAKHKMESCNKGKELRNTEINEVSEQCELSSKSNSTITHRLNTLELINNWWSQRVKVGKLQRKFESSDPASKRDRNAPISMQGFGPITVQQQQQQQQQARCSELG